MLYLGPPNKFLYSTSVLWSRDSAVGTVTGYGLDDRGVGVRVHVGARGFTLLHSVQTGSGDQPSLLTNGYWGVFSGDTAAGA
jgi:hypothetical protein